MKIFIENCLNDIFLKIGIDKPANFDLIAKFIIEDVKASSSYSINGDFHSGDVDIAFRRFIECISEKS